MPKTLPDAYVPVHGNDVGDMARRKLVTLGTDEAAEHESNIKALMTDRTLPSWWSGSKPAPDISYEEAKLEYERPIDPDNWGERVYGTGRDMVINRFAQSRERCNRLLVSVTQAIYGESILVASDTLNWLRK